MKFANIQEIIQLRDSGMRKKDKIYWGPDSFNIWHCWMNTVIGWLEKRAKRSVKIKNSVSVNSENSEA